MLQIHRTHRPEDGPESGDGGRDPALNGGGVNASMISKVETRMAATTLLRRGSSAVRKLQSLQAASSISPTLSYNLALEASINKPTSSPWYENHLSPIHPVNAKLIPLLLSRAPKPDSTPSPRRPETSCANSASGPRDLTNPRPSSVCMSPSCPPMTIPTPPPDRESPPFAG